MVSISLQDHPLLCRNEDTNNTQSLSLIHTHTLSLTHTHTDIDTEGPPQPTQVKYSQPLPLPTYAQSEKYEADGVLEYDRSDTPQEETEEVINQRQVKYVGSWCEFFIFFFSESALP